MAEAITDLDIHSYHDRKNKTAEPLIKAELERRSWMDKHIVNRYVVENPSSPKKTSYYIQTGGNVYQLELTRKGNRIFGYGVDFSLRFTSEDPWYQGDDGKAGEIETSFNFGDVEAGSGLKTNTKDGNLLEIEGYSGDGFYVELDKSEVMGEIGLHVETSPEGAKFKVRYFQEK